MPKRNAPVAGPIAWSIRVKTWGEAVELSKRLDGWVFRGQASSRWRLTTTLERLAAQSDFSSNEFNKREEQIYYRFRRQALQYLPHRPAANDFLAWFSIVQHHGGPTRLLDFTRSFYTSAHFALQDARETCSIWAVNAFQLDRTFATDCNLDFDAGHAPTMRGYKVRVANSCIANSFGVDEPWPDDEEPGADKITDRPNVIVVEPEQLNQRMVSQQGVFLMPTLPHEGFERNLIGGFSRKMKPLTPLNQARLDDILALLKRQSGPLSVLRIDLPAKVRVPAMQDLIRMNIHDASLFPGLDGFARSLRSVFLSPAEAE